MTISQPRSVKDLASYGQDDEEKGGESAQNYTGGAGSLSEGSWEHSYQKHHQCALMD